MIARPACIVALSTLLATGAAISESTVGPDLTVSSVETITPLVELYTSEGCSSCPRADQYLTNLGAAIDDDFHAVPLAFHVDYWNWLGWEDPFSKSQYTERQRLIAEYNRQRSIYTPELVVTGREARGGKGIVEFIQASNRERARVSIDVGLSASGTEGIDADISFDNMLQGVHAEAYVALYENDITREIKGGENRGLTITYNYVVRHWSEPFRIEAGASKKMLTLQLGDDWDRSNLGFAVVVVDSENGETLQAVRTPLQSLFPG